MIREEHIPQPEVEERQPWIYTYGDLFTLLVAFFVILIADSEQGKSETAYLDAIVVSSVSGGPPASPYYFSGSPTVIQNQYNIIEAISERSEYTDITLDDRGLVVSLNSSVAFASGSANLSEESRRIISNFSKLLYNLPNSIVIGGHTDNLPINSDIYSSNWHLSAARAAAVALEFQRFGIQADRLEVVGYADTRPKVSNVNAVARSINRRIEILIRPD